MNIGCAGCRAGRANRPKSMGVDAGVDGSLHLNVGVVAASAG